MKAIELFRQLNQTDEVAKIEAKPGTGISKSVMETICAYANEPGIEEGYILLGAIRDESSLFPQYIIDPITESDKLQSELATNCASMFNRSIRPDITIEEINGEIVAVIKVTELPLDQKPLYFKSEGLPRGAYRRIGPTDHRCTEDDMHLFYSNEKSFDSSLIDNTNLGDIDELAVKRYRDLRKSVNQFAEELTFSDKDLLQSLGCYAADGSKRISIAGLILFGKSSSLRRVFPMQRVDYIRVNGIDWVEDPDERYTTIDMRGPLLTLIFRIVDAVYSDLPKGFKLENNLQAGSTGMPVKVLREAITNALMHRSYRVSSPIQVIRYDNRLEIINPGFSLKSEDSLGSPGSETRNPFIAAVFHETNLAETKGSGIRAMKKLLLNAQLAPPTFSSNRDSNQFIARLLLHHFLSKQDINWLQNFDDLELNDSQKQSLIFIRETGAIDNNAYRQLSDNDTLKSSNDLRQLRELGLIEQKGKGRATYYIPSQILINPELRQIDAKLANSNTEPEEINTEPVEINTEPKGHNTEPIKTNTEPKGFNTEPKNENDDRFSNYIISKQVKSEILNLKARERDSKKVKDIIKQLCSEQELSLSDLSQILKKDENWISRSYIKPLIDEGKLEYKYPTVKNHPEQAYKVKK